MTEYQVIPAGRGGKVSLTFPSGLEMVCRKMAYPILVEKDENKSSVSVNFSRIDKDFDIDAESLVVSDNYLELVKSRRKK